MHMFEPVQPHIRIIGTTMTKTAQRSTVLAFTGAAVVAALQVAQQTSLGVCPGSPAAARSVEQSPPMEAAVVSSWLHSMPSGGASSQAPDTQTWLLRRRRREASPTLRSAADVAKRRCRCKASLQSRSAVNVAQRSIVAIAKRRSVILFECRRFPYHHRWR